MNTKYERLKNSHFNSYKVYKALLKYWKNSSCIDKQMMIQELENAIHTIEEQNASDLAAQDFWQDVVS